MFQKPVFGRKGASVAKPEEKKGFAPLLSGLFEGVGPQPDLGNLSDELKRIDLFGRGLGRKALRFVATGEPVGFAQELEAIVDKVGRTVWASEYFSDSEAKNSTQLQSAVTLAKGEIADPQAVARFIAVRRAVYPHERTLGRGRPDLPNSELLIRELYTLVAQGDRHLNQHSYHVDPKPAVVPTLSPRAVFRLTIELGGNPAPRSLIEYWIGMAVKLKDPGNTGLFGIYLDQLMSDDAKTLSGRILQGWIDFDTFGPSLEEANAYAQRQVDATRLRWQQGYYHGNPRGSQEEELASLFAYYKRERLNKLPNTGTKSKGILALACRAEPAFAAERVRWFLKKYGRRSHQAMALLDMLAGMNSPTAMQVVIAAATRLKQKSTMAHANAIAERYAKDRGWSYDELADRTVPTAGFDDDGIMDLPCGPEEKPYSARIDASLTIHISNPDGKVIKSLPSGDDETTKESKKALSAGKRELKQIVNMQTQRLVEALAAERQWPVQDWLESFHGHPVMRRLIERLVWQGIDEDGDAQGLLRPTQEGDFTNAEDEDIDVRAFAHLRLAHAALVEPELADAWRVHLKDYEVKPLIDQFPKGFKPFGGEAEDATAVTDRHGWLGESRSYRGIAEKLGYQREMGDGGGTIGYYKTFGTTGLTAVIQTNGGHAVDENVPQALKDLIFRRKGSYNGAPLVEVPPVLLAMCHADLHAIAKKGAFDEEWESKTDW